MADNSFKIKNALNLEPQAAPPSNGVQGDVYIDTSGILYTHNGTAWVASGTPTLTQNHILVGDASNVAADVAMSGDISIDSTGATAIVSGVIVNADVNAAAAIAYSKLAALTASKVLVSNASGVVTPSTVTSTTLGYLDATSSIQTQLDAKASATGLSDHLADTTDAHAGSAITNTPSGNLAATTVQGALNELQSDIDTRALNASPTLTGTLTTPNAIISGLTATTVPYLNASKQLTSSAVTPTQLSYLDATSSVQTQLDAKAPLASPTHTGTLTTPNVIVSGLTATTVPYLNASKQLTSSAVTPTQLGYLDATSSIQTQLNAKAPSTSATLTTPTIDVITLDDQASTPANPSAGFYKLYAKTDGKVYKLNSAGTETELGAGGAGGINYVQASGGNPDAEAATTGWTTYADGATASPVDLTGGSPSATWTRVTATPLRGAGSFLFTAGALGNGVAYTITPDRADIKKGAVMTVSFDYEVSGTTTTGDYTVWVYDVANSALIQPTGYQVQGGISGAGYKHQPCTFQLPTNGTTFRVGIHQAVASPAGNLTVDNVTVGPQAIQYGAPVTDWVSYTPTHGLTGGTTTATGQWRRVGAMMEVEAKLALTTVFTGGSATISLPSGYTIDTSKLIDSTIPPFGVSWFRKIGVDTYSGVVTYSSTTAVQLYALADDSGTGTGYNGLGSVNTTNPATWANGDYFMVRFSVPISGWSSTVQMSNDTDTRVVAAQYTTTAGTNFTSGTPTDIPFAVKVYDTHNAFATPSYTCPLAGKYRVTVNIITQAANFSTAQEIQLYTKKNSSADYAGSVFGNGASHVQSVKVTKTYDCVAGDTLGAQLATDVSVSLSTTSGRCYLEIERLTGPSAIAASEKVYLQYINNAAGTPTADVTNLDWSTKVQDSHGAWSGTVFTAPRAGLYLFAGNVKFGTVRDVDIGLWIDGVKKAEVNQTQATNSNGRHTISGGYYMNAGQTLSFRLSNSYALGSSTTQHTITIWSQG